MEERRRSIKDNILTNRKLSNIHINSIQSLNRVNAASVYFVNIILILKELSNSENSFTISHTHRLSKRTYVNLYSSSRKCVTSCQTGSDHDQVFFISCTCYPERN